MKILVVDDEEEILNMLKRALSLEDYEVVTVSEPHKAIELMKSELFNLVLCDIRMPGMSGLDLLKVLKQINPLANILMMTGYSSLFYVVDCLGSGAVDYLIKPFEDIEIVRKALDEARNRIHRWQTALRIRSFPGVDELSDSPSI
ncbi:MAG: response regulator [Deltaproteobacteria bacterium]|nr:response regulator [Deltaproteobacteria bacterium]MBW2050748.1 response regulator [Deltaproteobacteria bacterium]MBW2140459.1 response regulator [Deltaproteobacteria bacterium]MBW2321992.1 response regulator [Deltaproteobacteria bacterium]